MSKVRTFRAVILVVLGACSPLYAGAARAQVFQSVDFSERPGPTTIISDGVEVTLQPTKDSDDQIEVAAAIRIPGYQAIIVSEGAASSAYYKRWVGIGKLAATDPTASVLLQGFTGGAHCCATLQIITPSAGKLRVLNLEPTDGEGEQTFPRDIDGDGIVDIVRQDDNFRYAFASGAGSYSPPILFNVYKGQLVDVSTQPAYRPIWQKVAAQTRTACSERSNDDRNGACAAYVAAEARLGQYEAAMAEVEKLANQKAGIVLPDRCKVALVEYTCPAGKELKFYTFGSALRWFLREHGYID